MKTLDKYVAREMMVPFAAGFSIVLVLLVGTIIYNNIDFIVAKMKYWPDLLYWVALQLPYWVMIALPSGALFGCSLAISRLARDSEITMMRMAGIRVTRIFLPVFAVGCLISLTAYLFQEKVTVWAQDQSVRVQRRLYLAPGPPPIQPQVFFRVDNYCFYVNAVERKGDTVKLRDLMVYELPYDHPYASLTTAKTATEKSLVWTLWDGVTYRIGKDGDPELMGRFDKMEINMQRAMADFIDQQQKVPGAMTITELQRQVSEMRKRGWGQQARSYDVELNFKLALPLCSLVLLFCVAPLSLKSGKSGSFMGMLIGIMVLFVYWNIFVFSRKLAENGALNPFLAGWSEVIIFTVVGAFLMWKVE